MGHLKRHELCTRGDRIRLHDMGADHSQRHIRRGNLLVGEDRGLDALRLLDGPEIRIGS